MGDKVGTTKCRILEEPLDQKGRAARHRARELIFVLDLIRSHFMTRLRPSVVAHSKPNSPEHRGIRGDRKTYSLNEDDRSNMS